jgi:hypothetical protein
MAPKRGRRLQKGPEPEGLEALAAPPPRRVLVCLVLLVAVGVSAVSFYLLAGLNLGLSAAAGAEGGPAARVLRGGGEVFPTTVPLPSRVPAPAAEANGGLKPGETFCTPDHCGEGANRGAKFTWP